jgi:hypothetical protein
MVAQIILGGSEPSAPTAIERYITAVQENRRTAGCNSV